MVLWSFSHPWGQFSPRRLSVSLCLIVGLLLMSRGLSQGWILAMGSAWQRSSCMKIHTNTRADTPTSEPERGRRLSEPDVSHQQRNTHSHAHSQWVYGFTTIAFSYISGIFVQGYILTHTHTLTHSQQTLLTSPRGVEHMFAPAPLGSTAKQGGNVYERASLIWQNKAGWGIYSTNWCCHHLSAFLIAISTAVSTAGNSPQILKTSHYSLSHIMCIMCGVGHVTFVEESGFFSKQVLQASCREYLHRTFSSVCVTSFCEAGAEKYSFSCLDDVAMCYLHF